MLALFDEVTASWCQRSQCPWAATDHIISTKCPLLACLREFLGNTRTPLQEGPLISDLERGDMGLCFTLHWSCKNYSLLISRTEYADVVLGRGDVHETNARYCGGTAGWVPDCGDDRARCSVEAVARGDYVISSRYNEAHMQKYLKTFGRKTKVI